MERVIVILLMALVTYLPRVIPLIILSRIKLPPIILKGFCLLPVAILGSLLFPLLLMPTGELALSPKNPFLMASIPTFLVAMKTKNLLLTVLMGMLALVVLTL